MRNNWDQRLTPGVDPDAARTIKRLAATVEKKGIYLCNLVPVIKRQNTHFLIKIMTTQTADIHANIDTLIQQIEQAFAMGKASEIADCYSDAGMLLPAGFDFIKGKEAIQAFWQEAMDMGIAKLKLDLIDVEQHDGTAIETSSYTMLDADDQVIDQGKGIVIWKHEQGSWKLYKDIWTTSIALYPDN